MTVHTPFMQSTPPHTPPTFSPSTPKSTQWETIQSYLETLSPESMSSDHTWLENVDKPILLTLLAKKRSELDLLRSEAAPAALSSLKQHVKRDSVIEVPSAGYSTPQSTHHRYPSEDTKNTNYHGSNAARQSSSSLPSRKSTDISSSPFSFPPSPVSPMTPLSPDFGPRRGSAFSGTVERRRSSTQFSEFGGSNGGDATTTGAGTPTPSLEKLHPAGKRMNRNLENRVLWEAAWKEIDANIEEYVDRFSDDGGGSEMEMGMDKDKGKQGVWKAIVEAGRDVGDVKKKARKACEAASRC